MRQAPATRRLRVEEPAAEPVAERAAEAPLSGEDHWRKIAVQTGERLKYAEAQAADLRKAADEARARFSKYKDRLDKANAQVNELQVQLVTTSAERDELRAQLAAQATVARKVHEFRQSILDGPLWDLFVELAVSPQ